MSHKTTISVEDYYKVCGLAALAHEGYAELRNIERTLAGLLGEADDGHGYFGHVSDFVYEWPSGRPDDLLRRLEIKMGGNEELEP
jgi:hypothetical protein